MRAYLTRRRIGVYMLTEWKPVKEKVGGFGPEDWYPDPGDPLGWTAPICGMTVKNFLGRTLRRMDSIEIELEMREIGGFESQKND
jgi:hypothetical protein